MPKVCDGSHVDVPTCYCKCRTYIYVLLADLAATEELASLQYPSPLTCMRHAVKQPPVSCCSSGISFKPLGVAICAGLVSVWLQNVVEVSAQHTPIQRDTMTKALWFSTCN